MNTHHGIYRVFIGVGAHKVSNVVVQGILRVLQLIGNQLRDEFGAEQHGLCATLVVVPAIKEIAFRCS